MPYSSCPAYKSSERSYQASQCINSSTTPTTARSNALDPSSAFNFTADDITAMFALCGYEIVIRGSSRFCDLSLFTPDKWPAFEYAKSIMPHD